MDQLHSLNDNFNKVHALFEAIQQLNDEKGNLTHPTLIHQIESLKALSLEAEESLDTMKLICDAMREKYVVS